MKQNVEKVKNKNWEAATIRAQSNNKSNQHPDIDDIQLWVDATFNHAIHLYHI